MPRPPTRQRRKAADAPSIVDGGVGPNATPVSKQRSTWAAGPQGGGRCQQRSVLQGVCVWPGRRVRDVVGSACSAWTGAVVIGRPRRRPAGNGQREWAFPSLRRRRGRKHPQAVAGAGQGRPLDGRRTPGYAGNVDGPGQWVDWTPAAEDGVPARRGAARGPSRPAYCVEEVAMLRPAAIRPARRGGGGSQSEAAEVSGPGTSRTPDPAGLVDTSYRGPVQIRAARIRAWPAGRRP